MNEKLLKELLDTRNTFEFARIAVTNDFTRDLWPESVENHYNKLLEKVKGSFNCPDDGINFADSWKND